MVVDKRVETLQEEIKLLKGEVKHSLASVRDYLLNSELPSADLSNLDLNQGEQRIIMKNLDATAAASKLASEIASNATEDAVETPPEDEDLISVEPPLDEESAVSEAGAASQQMATGSPQDALLSEEEVEEVEEEEEREEEETAYPRSELLQEETLPEEDTPMSYDRTALDDSPNTPRVNMLANLITWVARAKKEIGYEQLPNFLEVYGLSGHLSPEMKEVILHFAEIAVERPDTAGSADIWSQSMLSLHGILTGGDAPLHPAIPAWTRSTAEEPADEKEEPVEEDGPRAPVKLKLVFPDGKGSEKEFCLHLTPEADGRRRRKSSREG
jgi:hypothetical protein